MPVRERRAIKTEPNIETRRRSEYIGAYISDGLCLINTYHLLPSNQLFPVFNVDSTGAKPIMELFPPWASSSATPQPGLGLDINLMRAISVLWLRGGKIGHIRIELFESTRVAWPVFSILTLLTTSRRFSILYLITTTAITSS